MQDLWYEQQVESISEAFHELLIDGDPEQGRQGLRDAIQSWTDHHEKELVKWNALKKLLGL